MLLKLEIQNIVDKNLKVAGETRNIHSIKNNKVSDVTRNMLSIKITKLMKNKKYIIDQNELLKLCRNI